jgi:hypothetical protein
MAKKVTKRSRSAKDGKFVTAAKVKKNPNTTVTETVKKPCGKKKKK